jgi:hypothetical protein
LGEKLWEKTEKSTCKKFTNRYTHECWLSSGLSVVLEFQSNKLCDND